MSELRVVVLGNSWSDTSSVADVLLGENKFSTEEEPEVCMKLTRLIKDKTLVLINTPNMLLNDISLEDLTKHVETCVSLSDPGPHVFLLVLQPEDFTDQQKQKLESILENTSDQTFDHSIVLVSKPRMDSSGSVEQYMQQPPLKEIIQKCKACLVWPKSFD